MKAGSAVNDRLVTASRVVDRDTRERVDTMQAALDSLRAVVNDKRRFADEATLWLVELELRCATLTVARTEFLVQCLKDEVTPDSAQELETADLQQLVAHVRDEADSSDPRGSSDARAAAVELLWGRYQRRAEDRRHRDARAARKRQLLTVVAVVLTGLVLVAGWSIWRLGLAQPSEMAMVLVIAMLGGAVSGVRQLRDELLRIDELNAFVSGFAAQLAVSAGLGTVVVLLFRAELLPTIPGGATSQIELAMLGLYSFVAGYAEPFVIGAVQRLAGSGGASTS